jgi:hypothetical protein
MKTIHPTRKQRRPFLLAFRELGLPIDERYDISLFVGPMTVGAPTRKQRRDRQLNDRYTARCMGLPVRRSPSRLVFTIPEATR